MGVFLTRQPQILVLDPQLAHEILVTNFSDFRDTLTSNFVAHAKDYDKYIARNPFFSAGDEWKKRRVDAGAGLTPNKLKQAFAIWEQTGEKLVDFMQRSIEGRDSNIIETRDVGSCVSYFYICISQSIYKSPCPAALLSLHSSGHGRLHLGHRCWLLERQHQ